MRINHENLSNVFIENMTAYQGNLRPQLAILSLEMWRHLKTICIQCSNTFHENMITYQGNLRPQLAILSFEGITAYHDNWRQDLSMLSKKTK